MKKTLWTIALALGMAGNVKAQGVDDVLRTIEQNNKELQSLAQAAHAASLDVQSRNNLEDPTVEYSPFYAKGIDGVATSELIVSQSFDFPTLYAARHQAGCNNRPSACNTGWPAATCCWRPRTCVWT